MKLLVRLCAGLLVACSLTGCCWSSGYFDPATGFTYGAGWQPCCWANPFCWLCHCRGAQPPYGYGAPYGYGYEFEYGGYGWGASPAVEYPAHCGVCQTPMPVETSGHIGGVAGSPICPNCQHQHAAPADAVSAVPPGVYSVPEVPAGVYDGVIYDDAEMQGPVHEGMPTYEGPMIYQGPEVYEGTEVYEEGTVVPPSDSAPPAPTDPPPAPPATESTTSFKPPRILRRPASRPKPVRNSKPRREPLWKKWLPVSF